MWAFRLAAIPLAIVLFVVLIRNFYTSDPYAGMCVRANAMITWSFNNSQHVPAVGTYLAYLLLRMTTVKELVRNGFVLPSLFSTLNDRFHHHD